MIRRNARLRKEYLYRKSLEGKEKATYERKRQIRKALDGEQLCGCTARNRLHI
jgi:U3 small nucleolar ribonucleoprotein protein IMP4